MNIWNDIRNKQGFKYTQGSMQAPCCLYWTPRISDTLIVLKDPVYIALHGHIL